VGWDQLVVPFEVEPQGKVEDGQGQVIHYLASMVHHQLTETKMTGCRFAVFTDIATVTIFAIMEPYNRIYSTGLLPFLPSSKPAQATAGFILLYNLCQATPSALNYPHDVSDCVTLPNGLIVPVVSTLGFAQNTTVVVSAHIEKGLCVIKKSTSACIQIATELNFLEELLTHKIACDFIPTLTFPDLCDDQCLVTTPVGVRLPPLPLDCKAIIQCTICVVRALQTAAKLGYIHCDVHLGNIVQRPPPLGPGGGDERPKYVLLDWGLACHPRDSAGNLGVPCYAPSHVLLDASERYVVSVGTFRPQNECSKYSFPGR